MNVLIHLLQQKESMSDCVFLLNNPNYLRCLHHVGMPILIPSLVLSNANISQFLKLSGWLQQMNCDCTINAHWLERFSRHFSPFNILPQNYKILISRITRHGAYFFFLSRECVSVMCFRKRDCESYFHDSQVRPRKPSRGLLLAFLWCVDVWRDAVGDVHLLWGALVRADGQTGTCMSTTCDIFVEHGIGRRPCCALFRCRDSGPDFPYCSLGWIQILWRVEREGERLEKPPDCPQEMYSVMRKCWACNPSERPNFTQLATLIAEVVQIC